MKITILITISLLLVSTAFATDRMVRGEYETIQDAINDCDDGDVVIVADGIYTGDGNRDIYLLEKEITVRSENGPDGCIIDCNGTEAEPHRAFYLKTNSRIVGFTIINGYAREGGAVLCEHSSPTVINCILNNNSAERGGGAIYCRNGAQTIINCTINSNSAEYGGGIWCEYSSLTVNNCVITSNLAQGNGWIFGGGGIYASRSNIDIINSQINQNSANNGGGIYCWEDSSLTIVNSTISDNTAKGRDSSGGGISFVSSYADAKFIITNCTVIGNLVEDGWGRGGGGIFCYTGHGNDPVLIITGCTVNNNAAKVENDRDRSYGGGICFYRGSPIISKCKISGNMATEGGGVACEQSKPIIAGCIISGNSPLDRDKFGGGGIHCRGGSTTISNCTILGNAFFGIYCQNGEAAVTNSILYYNGNGKGHLDQIHHSSATVTYSDVQTEPSKEPWPGVGNINADPCFVQPGYWDANSVWVEGDYHLLSDSPCIDAGGATSYSLASTDMEDNPRVSGRQIDMGAYEFSTSTISAEVNISPDTLNLNSKGKWVKAYFTLPPGFSPEDVDVNEPALAEPMDIESEYVKVLGNDDGFVRVEVAFDRQAFCDTITDDGPLEVTVIGSFTTGGYFYGTDTIRIKPPR